MAIWDDFTIDYVNKRIWNKYAWGQGGSTTVYTVQDFYSELMDVFDEQGAMDDDVPISAQTPNAYTMINAWFIDDESVKYLKTGAIETARGDTKILKMVFQESGYTSCIFSDITKQVVWDASNHGALLAYNNTRRVWWCRTADSCSPPKAITIADSGTYTLTIIGTIITDDESPREVPPDSGTVHCVYQVTSQGIISVSGSGVTQQDKEDIANLVEEQTGQELKAQVTDVQAQTTNIELHHIGRVKLEGDFLVIYDTMEHEIARYKLVKDAEGKIVERIPQ